MTGQSSWRVYLRQLSGGVGVGPPYLLSAAQEVLMGRDPQQCQISLESSVYPGVSRRHAALRPLYGQHHPDGSPCWQICDLNSANGTWLNGQRLQGCQTLHPGDRILLSQNGPEFILEYELSSPEAGAIAAAPSLAANPIPAATANTGLTWSQILPIVSKRRDLAHKAYLVPGVLTVIFVVLLFITSDSPQLFNLLLALYLGGAGYAFIYQLCGQPKPWWIIAIAALSTILLLLSPVLSLFILVFRGLLPGNIDASTTSFSLQLIGHFFGAGLMEELFKVLPVLGLFYLGRSLRSPWRQRVGVWEPLDGILLAAASALGFTWLETLGQYVPGVAQQVAQMSGTAAAGQLAGLQILIPRILGSVAGHMAYSGYFGYFIGLSILKPSRRWQILGIGYLTSSLLHALWNASAGTFGPLALAGVGIVAYVFLAAAILKARELSPRRSQNFATRSTP